TKKVIAEDRIPGRGVRYLRGAADSLLFRLLDGLRHEGLELGHEDVREVARAVYRGSQRCNHDLYISRRHAREFNVEAILKRPKGRGKNSLKKGPREVVIACVDTPGKRVGHVRGDSPVDPHLKVIHVGGVKKIEADVQGLQIPPKGRKA